MRMPWRTLVPEGHLSLLLQMHQTILPGIQTFVLLQVQLQRALLDKLRLLLVLLPLTLMSAAAPPHPLRVQQV